MIRYAALAIAFMALCGCAGKQFASTTVQKLEAAATERERFQVEAIKMIVNTVTDQTKKLALTRLELARERTKNEMVEEVRAAQHQLVDQTLDQIDTLFQPVVADLEEQLSEEAELALKTGDPSKEHRAALHLSTTLMAHSRETATFTSYINSQFNDLNAQAINNVNEKFDNAKAELNDYLQSSAVPTDRLEADSIVYVTNMDTAYSELRRYIERTDPLKLFQPITQALVKELVPKSGVWGELLQAATDGIVGKADSLASKASEESSTQVDDAVEDVVIEAKAGVSDKLTTLVTTGKSQ